MQIKVYLSGPVTGRDPHETEHLFKIAEKAVRNLGLEPVNPLNFCTPDMEWCEAMKVCIRVLLDCHLITMLPGWEESKGAPIEYNLAKELGINNLNLKQL